MLRILVVDDSVSVRAFVGAVLEAADFAARYGGCEVVEARGGFEAMRLLPRAHYDLIVTDIAMADINGLELVRFVRSSQRHHATPLLIISTLKISTLKSEQDIERGLAIGADAYLPKPFTAPQLRNICMGLIAEAPARPRPSEAPAGGA